MKQNENFISSIESLRGVAALMVAFAHSIGAALLTTEHSANIRSLINIIANGGMGVTIFFVLSGFVLRQSIERSQHPFIAGNLIFLWKRFLRIWPAMFVSVVFCFLWVKFFYTPSSSLATSSEYKAIWVHDPGFTQLLENLLFIKNSLNLVTWTLQVEMVAAFFMLPLLFIKQKSQAFFFLILAVWLMYFFIFPMYSNARVGFTFMFILGMLVEDIARTMNEKLSLDSLIKISYISFAVGCLINYLIPGDHKIVWFLMALISMFNIASLVALHRKGGEISLLNTPALKYIGKTSFSFYLWHFPVLLIMGTFLFEATPEKIILEYPNLFGFILFVFSVLATLPISHISYKKIEIRYMSKTFVR